MFKCTLVLMAVLFLGSQGRADSASPNEALCESAATGNLARATQAISEGAEIDKPLCIKKQSSPYSHVSTRGVYHIETKATPFSVALETNSAAVADLLIRTGAVKAETLTTVTRTNCSMKYPFKPENLKCQTPQAAGARANIHAAAKFGQAEMLKTFLDKGGDANFSTSRAFGSHTVLEFALDSKSAATIDLALRAGARIDFTYEDYGWNDLTDLFNSGRMEELAKVLSFVDPVRDHNIVQAAFDSALSIRANRFPTKDYLKLLIARGADTKRVQDPHDRMGYESATRFFFTQGSFLNVPEGQTEPDRDTIDFILGLEPLSASNKALYLRVAEAEKRPTTVQVLRERR